MFMMGLSKAFDCIPHELLIAKLHAYGFSKESLKLTYSYLKGRNQRVKINSNYSSWREILNGVPQGSILGPLLFNISIKDLFFFVENSQVCNYDDDNSLTVADVDLDKIIGWLGTDIDIMDRRFNNNGMLLNEDKCHFMIIEPTWKTRHIIWMHCQRKSNNLINRIHERASRIAYNDYESNFKQLLEKDNSVTIHHRNIQALATEIYKTLNNLNPIFMKEIFSLKTYNFPIRTQNLNYPNPRTVSDGVESFGYKGSRIWKRIPKEI